jgi:hypothetical protein
VHPHRLTSLHEHTAAAAAACRRADGWGVSTACGTSCGVYKDGVPGGCFASKMYAELLPDAGDELEVESTGQAGDGSYCA